VVTDVQYGQKSLTYKTFRPFAVDVLRLSYLPRQVRVGDAAIAVRNDLKDEGYTVTPLKDGDYIIRINHRQSETVRIQG
jgi:hypothetical protein